MGRLLLLSCVVSMISAAVMADDQSWRELERLDVCSDVENPSVGETCILCPTVLQGVSVWRCCHDPIALEDCAAAVDTTLGDSGNAVDKRRTKYFLGKKRGVKYFLGKRSIVHDASMPPFYNRQQASRRPQQASSPDKRVKYFLG